MKNKHGFTLAEVLLTLGIIGVVAALTLPAANSLMPDQTKIMYLKAYDTVSETMKNLASNKKLFPLCNSNNINCTNYPFINTDKPLDPKYEDCEGSTKLCKLFALSLGAEALKCPSSIMWVGTDFDDWFDENISFTTQNGFQWSITMLFNTGSMESIFSSYSNVAVDVNGNTAPNCIYDEEKCPKPDRFRFFVYTNGVVQPADPVGLYYTNTRTSLTRKNFEIENTAYPNLDTSLQTVLTTTCN